MASNSKNNMRLVLSACLLAILVLPWFGTRAWISCERNALKKSLKHRMIEEAADDQLVSITVAVNEIFSALEWEHSEEFKYNGSMYDVVRSYVDSDSITFICWWDAEESQLEQKLHDILAYRANKVPDDSKPVIALFSILKQAFLQDYATAGSLNLQHQATLPRYATTLYAQAIQAVPVPPPR